MRKYFFVSVICVLSTAAFSATPGQIESKEFEASQIKKLEISLPKGDVTLTGSKTAKKITVAIEKIHFDPKCKFQTTESGGTLKIEVLNESGLFEKINCLSKIKIEAPASLKEIEASTASGNLQFAGVDSVIDFKTASGNVDIKGEMLKTITGKTASGNISLSFMNCPKRADIDLLTASGDADIRLGTNCKIRVNHKSAAGELFNEMGDSEDYQVLISMKSASGDLKIKKLTK